MFGRAQVCRLKGEDTLPMIEAFGSDLSGLPVSFKMSRDKIFGAQSGSLDLRMHLEPR